MKLFKKSSKPSSNEMLNDLTTISRMQTIDGFSIPGIILNMQYHFTDIQVYRDGLVHCWEMVDLELFKKKLNNKWVVTSIPNGERISIFSLGNWTIDQGEWLYDKETFFEYVYSLIQRMNPQLENLYNCHGRTTEKIGHVTVSIFAEPNPKPYYISNNQRIFPERTNGEKFYIFFRDIDNKLYLAELSIFKNGHVEITSLPQKRSFGFSDIRSLIDDRKIITNIPVGERIYVMGLGSFISIGGYGVDVESKYKEFLDKYDTFTGGIGSLEKCRQVFEKYKIEPTTELKEKLKQAYEDIPEHQRIFVGDMDTKDLEIRHAIYGDIEKKE